MPDGQRESLRWDAAQRACRDGDVKTLKWLFDNAKLFDDKEALCEACISGAWGSGNEALSRPFSTSDSVRLHTMLQTAAARGHVNLMGYLLSEFPAKDLHIAEWEVVINAIAQCSVPMLEILYSVDPGFVKLSRPGCRSPLTAVFRLTSEDASQFPAVVRYLLEKGTQPGANGQDDDVTVLQEAAVSSDKETIEILREYGAEGNDSSLLRIAVYHGNHALADYLIRSGVRVDDYADEVNDLIPVAGTALGIAAYKGSYDMVERLIVAGADLSKARIRDRRAAYIDVDELKSIKAKLEGIS